MEESGIYHLTAVGKLLRRRVKKTKLFWLGCVPSGKRLNRDPKSNRSVCDGQTQTTPSIQKTVSDRTVTGSSDAGDACEVLQMPAESCVVDSSRDNLDSDSEMYMGSCCSHAHSEIGEDDIRKDQTPKFANCSCIGGVEVTGMCMWRLHGNLVMEKLETLQEEVNALRATLCSLQFGNNSAADLVDTPSSSTSPAAPPPPPPPPPPFPTASVGFLHSVSLSSLTHRPKSQFEEAPVVQERGKPIITLEELQKVKLRQVSSVINVNTY